MRHLKQESKDLANDYRMKDYIIEEFSEQYRLIVIYDDNNDIFSVNMKRISE